MAKKITYNKNMDVRILLLESNQLFARAIKQRIETTLGFQVLWYRSFIDFMEPKHDYSKIDLAIIDYDLPDSRDGEALKFCFEKSIPTLLLASKITADIQEKIWSFKIIDYILRGTHHSTTCVVDLIKRFFNNHKIGILIVDDSNESRDHLNELLTIHKYNIFQAKNGNDALETLADNYNKIHMVITAYDMGDMNGLELTQTLRKTYPIDRLAIIGISTHGNHTLKIQFIKSGANDFLNKPFISELLYCRISQNIKIIEYFKQIKELAIVDQLTMLNNRHFLKETGPLLYENAKRHNLNIVVAMIDIDDFKKVNDTYGHDVGDIVLKNVSTELRNNIRKSDLAVRYGGEEFLIIANNLDPKLAFNFFDEFRQNISNRSINIGAGKINVTVSIGLCQDKEDCLEQMIINADIKLYEAKTSGKNKVMI